MEFSFFRIILEAFPAALQLLKSDKKEKLLMTINVKFLCLYQNPWKSVRKVHLEKVMTGN